MEEGKVMKGIHIFPHLCRFQFNNPIKSLQTYKDFGMLLFIEKKEINKINSSKIKQL